MARETANSNVQRAAGMNGGRKSIEEVLANIWAGVLRVPRVDKTANFFEIGGDSLKAMEVIARVREVLRVDLPLLSFFEDPTVNHLAEVLSGGRGDLEEALTGIWGEVLHVQQIDRDANFFEIGGDSLKAMEVIARVSEMLGVDLPLIAFFEEPTIRHLADVMSAGQEKTADKLAMIWAEVLRVPHVANEANFFDIGGDSLKAMEVIVRVSQVLQVDLPLIAFFEDPTVAHLAQVIDELKDEGTTPPIGRAADRREFPLSYSQQVFWLLEQQNPESGIYNKPRIFRIHGKVDASVMERSLNELRERHEVLRVRFVSGVNGPVQIVEEDGALHFAVSDLSALSEVARKQVAMKLALQTVREPLALAGGQVQRARLIRFSDEEFLLCIAEHHVVNDGFTGSILLDELGAIYDAFAAGDPSPLPPLELHYTDFAAWERQWMHGQRLSDEVEYWRSLLQDAPTHLDLPTDFASSSEPDRRGNMRSFTLTGDLLTRIQQFAQSNGTTQFTILATALRLLLYRWSGQSDFLLGTTASNRSRSGTERMPGPFVNPLPLRNPVHGGQTALELLNREKKAVMEAFAHQDCPFAKIVEGVNPERTSNDNPLFNVGLVMENFPEIELKGRNFEAEYLNFDPEVSLLDLRFIAVEKHGGLRLSCEYKSALFTSETVDSLLQAYADVLGAIVASPERPLEEFKLPKTLARQAEASTIARRQAVAIAATFTAEPVKEPLEFWLQQLGMPVNIEFAPFNQVFQQLLDSGSLLATNQYGANVVLLRMEDLRVAEGYSAADLASGLHSSAVELLTALRVAARRTSAPLLLLITPASDWVRSNPELATTIGHEERELIEAAREIPRLQVVGSAALLDLYPVADYADEYNYKISHVPYKPAMFTALASMIARRIYTAHHAVKEVIVLDGDSTLGGASVGATRGELAEFLLAQEQAGAILGLCSRSSEADLSGRLDDASGGLGLQNIASTRTGVRAMSEAVKEITDELGLGLNRCIFVTGDPIDAAEVRANCPSVVVTELPAEAQLISAFLKNFWAFDRRPPVTPQHEAPSKPGILSLIATQLSSLDAIAQAIEAAKVIGVRVSEEYAAPRSTEEESLAAVWSRLLRVERPSIHANFFTLGGHSLMAAQVIARVRQTLGVELPLRAMFEAPTIAQFAERIESERRARTGIVRPPITRASREGRLPLSYAQQRLWFIDQLEPGSPAYNISAMYRLRGNLNVAALERTINEIVRRHESLRTTFSNVDGQAVAVILPEVVISLAPQMVSGTDEQAREEDLRRLARQEATKPFDLATGPLIRSRLLRISDEDHALLIVVHHIVGDGWSGSLIAGELAALYDAFTHDRSSPLPELAIQYADFSVWQRQSLDGEVRDRQLDYWLRQLADAPAVLELPTDRPRPAVRGHRGDIRTHKIPCDVVSRLQDMSHAEGATLFMTLMAAFQLLLSRYSGQDDIVVGSPIAGRNYSDLEPLIGFFVNTLAIRTDLSGDPTFRELLARVKKTALDAYAHQEVPFEMLVEALRPERSLSYNPVFQVSFGLQNMPRLVFEVSGLSVDRTSMHQGTSIFDMAWFVWETDEGLLLRVEYDTDLFDAATVERMACHYQALLEAAVAAPGAPVHRLGILTPEERHELLVEFNATSHPVPMAALPVLFEAQVTRTPDSVAVLFEDRSLSYRELNARANRLARCLIELRIGPECVVGICLERSLDLIVALLAVLKAGAAYLPLDPDYPPDRVAFMVADASPPVILTSSLLRQRLPHTAAVLILDSPETQAALGQASEHEPTDAERTAPLLPQHPAYVIYTSGSTGKPKGVVIEHRALVNHMAWMCATYPVSERDRVLSRTSINFDAAVWELWLPLLSGAALCLASEQTSRDPDALLDYMNQCGITVAQFVPTLLSATCDSEGPVPNRLRLLFSGGEPLTRELAQRTIAKWNVPIVNLYGPTETTIQVSHRRCEPPIPDAPTIPIGVPIWNAQMYVLDKHWEPVPVGVAGELYVGGAGLARGYLNQPELTAQKFIRDPFGRGADARVYKTGDLVRYLPDGNIEYLGRIDHQIKLRGFRIELGEIETTLESHPRVRQSVVMAHEDEPGNKRLVAYIVPYADDHRFEDGSTEGPQDTNLVTELRGWLSEKLPEFMVPSAFVVLEAMPLSPNGKINRNALPVPELSRDESEAFVGPRSPVEEKLTEIWAEVLHLPQISVHDNFFLLGGHSLLATQVVSRVRKWARVELPLRTMFEAPTVAELALRIEHLQVSANPLPQVRRASRVRSLPLSFAQQRLWFLNQLEPNSPYYNIPMALRMSGALHVGSLKRALNEIIRRHEILRTTYVVEGDSPVQVVTPEWTIDLPVVDMTHVPGEQQDSTLRQFTIEYGRHVFNLQTGPVIRASLLKLGKQDHVLLLNTHHIVSDGWSIWRFVEELAALYKAFIAGQPSPLPELLIQYADYAVWQRGWLRNEIIENQLSYWKKQLDGAPSTLDLPTDHTRPAIPSYRGATCRAIYPQSLGEKLNELGRNEGVTLYMTLLAAFQTLLFRYSGQDDFTVGSPIANRVHPEIEELIGFFVNTLVMRGDLSGNPTFRELLQRVREAALGAFSNQDVPFEKLVELLQPERDLRRMPLFQVLFVLQNAPRLQFRLSGLDITSMDVHNGTSKFDLAMFMVEKPEGLICNLEYSTEVFDSGTIQRLLGHFQVLLEAIVEDPRRRIGELPLLTEDERRQVIVKWNDTYQDFPRDRTLPQMIEDQVKRTPDATALVCGSRHLTYCELDARANQLAHWLRRHGVGPESLVAVCVERSTEMVVALLGILKAGGAYVPLDPAYPSERIKYVLDDAHVTLLLTQDSLLASLPSMSAEIVGLDPEWRAFQQEDTGPVATEVKPENLAYVIYTSGSTGRPKGVQLEHGSVVNFLCSMRREPGMTADDALVAVTTLSFDIAGLELFLPLLIGARVVIAPRDATLDGRLLMELLQQSGATIMQATPTTWRVLLESGWEGDANLKVLVGGEALPAELARQLADRCRSVWNMYGPTETTIWSSVYKVEGNDEALVPIGKPIANTTFYILDGNQQPVPEGVKGELYIGGEGLARGYFERIELTDEKFVPDPFDARSGARMYRTGDLARYKPDGNVEFLGRIDHQVKIRGFRIELGEVEAVLEQHPGVGQAVVIAREDTPGDKRLVAYVVADTDYQGSDDAEPAETLMADQVTQWAEAWDEAYRIGDGVAEATFNIAGWNSSYTGQAIPAEEMRVWVETTAERIRALGAKRVWEIGCGTGLLLFRVAPSCEHYHGTDISPAALSFLESHILKVEPRLPSVTLERKPAHHFDEATTSGQFDAVVLNSVIQYFPDLDYLLKVLEGVVASVRPGGRVFVGDVRSFPLLETFHTSVEVFKGDDALTREELWQRVQKGIRQEGELLIDPEFFSALRHRWPQITHAEIQLKRGRAHNELTRFRYDVVLHIGDVVSDKVECPWLDWKKQGLTGTGVAEILQKTQPEMLGLTGVPNARLRSEVMALELLASEDGSASLGELRQRLAASYQPGVEPEDLWSLEQELPYRVEIRGSKMAVDGCCDVVLRRKNAQGEVPDYTEPRYPGESDVIRPWAAYANNPLRQRVVGKLVPQLRLWVGGKLPEYMVPSAFVLLEAMPLTANGKVNRRALPAPDQSCADGLSDYTAPRTPMEEMVAAIFADVLRVERVGIDDNFFELGGHSLSATQVVSRIRQNLHVDVPVRTMFESPTVAALSRAVEQMQRGERGLLAPPIVRVPRDQRLPLSFAQQRLWVLDQIEPNNPLYSFPRPLRLAGELNVAALETALNKIIARHEVLRTTYGSKKGQPYQVISGELKQPLNVIDLSELPAAERDQEAHRLVEQEASTPFDLATGPVVRYVLLKLADKDHILMMTTHHIADDGWSTGILLRELSELYDSALKGEPSLLPALEIQYVDYAVWQRNWLQGEVLERQVAYWRQRLQGAPPVLQIPADRPRPEKPTYRGAIHRFLLPTSLQESVRTLSRQQGSTAFMTLMAGFQTMVLHYTGQTDVVLGTDLANRTTVQTEALIGFFVNLLALRTDLSDDPAFIELLARVRESALGAYGHQDVPFDKLVEELQPERSLSHNPIVQVLFVQQNTPRSPKPMPGLAMSWFPMDVPSKFDMAVFVSETDKGIAGSWVYSADMFDAVTIARMAALYQIVLERATINPTVRLSELLNTLAEEDQKHLAAQHKEFRQAGGQKLKTARRKTLAHD